MTATDTRTRSDTTPPATMLIADIDAEPRRRRRLGGTRDLQRSIYEIGLLHPVPVTEDGRLLAGERRLRACKNLGWTSIPVTIARDTDHAVELLRAEIENGAGGGPNTVPMTATELVTVGMLIEDLLRPVTTALRGRPNGGIRRPQTRDIAAGIVGMSIGQYARIRMVILASLGFESIPGSTGTVPIGPERQAEARSLLDLIDRVVAGEELPNPNGRLSRLTLNAICMGFARQRNSFSSIANQPAITASIPTGDLGPAPRAVRTDQRKSLGAAIGTLSGLCHGLASINTIDPAVSVAEATSWKRDLDDALRTIRTLRNKIREHANASR